MNSESLTRLLSHATMKKGLTSTKVPRRTYSKSIIKLNFGVEDDIDYDFFDPHSKTDYDHKNQSNTLFRNNFEHNLKKFNTTSRNKKPDFARKMPPINVTEVYKDLMNCIAFTGTREGNEQESFRNHVSRSNSNDSLSTDTTSDITDVTPCPSSSGCSSMSKQEPEALSILKSREKTTKDQKQQSDGTSMKLLMEALETLDSGTSRSLTNSSVSSDRGSIGSKTNLSFSNEETKRINYENQLLLRKIESQQKPKPRGPLLIPCHPRLPSSAINRMKQQQKIERDNLILLRKLETVKGTTGTWDRRR